MAVGPVQLIVLGFPHPNFHGEIIAELERLRQENERLKARLEQAELIIDVQKKLVRLFGEASPTPSDEGR